MATTTISDRRDDVMFASSDLPVEVTGMQTMASKMWVPLLGMGFMIVAIAFIVGLVTSSVAGDYFTASKLTREAAVTGSTLATQQAFLESTKIWLPAFKFFGIGMMLGGVTFLLATILGALRTGGGAVQEALGSEVRIIQTPMTAKAFPMLMMMGMMMMMIALIVAIPTATLSYSYWNHSIATQLNPALAGSGILDNLATINSIKLWLAPLKFLGMASLFAGIGMALATIVRVLRWQSGRLWEMLS